MRLTRTTRSVTSADRSKSNQCPHHHGLVGFEHLRQAPGRPFPVVLRLRGRRWTGIADDAADLYDHGHSRPVPVGSYPSSCSGASDPNYTVSYVPGVVQVGTSPLTITASSGSSTYGSVRRRHHPLVLRLRERGQLSVRSAVHRSVRARRLLRAQSAPTQRLFGCSRCQLHHQLRRRASLVVTPHLWLSRPRRVP